MAETDTGAPVSIDNVLFYGNVVVLQKNTNCRPFPSTPSHHVARHPFRYRPSGRNTTSTGLMSTPIKMTRPPPSSFVLLPDPTCEPFTCRGGDSSSPSSSGSPLPLFLLKLSKNLASPSKKSGLLLSSVLEEPF